MGRFLMQQLAKLGVNWYLGCELTSLQKLQDVHVLTLSNGEILKADAVLEAIGVRPRTKLALESGLAVGKGITVNAYLQTSARNIYAVGDCAEIVGEWQPFIAPLLQAARVAAQNIVGEATPLRKTLSVVTVKTTSCPVVVALPQSSEIGTWRIAETTGGIVAEFLDEDILRGFVLVGSSIGDKAKFVARITSADVAHA